MEKRVNRLEQDINKLKTAYDQYFAGIERIPPERLAARVASEVRALTSTTITNTALRFRNQQIISRYNSYSQYWKRNLRELEEGRKPRRKIFRAPATTPGATPTDTPAGTPTATPTATGAPKEKAPGVYEVSTGNSDNGGMDKLVSALSREYQSLGTGKTPDMKKVRTAVEQQTKALREKYGSEKVAFKVINKDGKVTIKASPADRRKP